MAKKPVSVDIRSLVEERLKLGGIVMSQPAIDKYMKEPDSLGEQRKGEVLPAGYKRCGCCREAKKYHLFNKNSAAKTGCTGSCKVCQNKHAKKSYKKTKKRRNYKKYYQLNKEMKQEQARKYYAENKEAILEKQAKYRNSKAGKAVMHKAHAKRRAAMAANAGIPYDRQLVIDRDGAFLGEKKPICWICGEPIKDTSGDHLHLDHVISIVNGGLDCFTNIACSHKTCNLSKTKDDRDVETQDVMDIIARSEAYIDQYPDKFE